MKIFFVKCASSFFFLGYSPLIPGTVGSLGGVFLYFFFVEISWVWFLTLLIFLFCLGVLVSNHAEKVFQSKDPGAVVIDEVLGMLLTFIGIPWNWKWILLGFVIFRILDIFKPFPARDCESLPGGLGIMLDDVVSGLYACALLHLIIFLTSQGLF